MALPPVSSAPSHAGLLPSVLRNASAKREKTPPQVAIFAWCLPHNKCHLPVLCGTASVRSICLKPHIYDLVLSLGT